ncbi:MAG TPA: hypothetical protein DDZ53_05035 [Firmicutes bacterium]|nr:hypothetical protein [Bacillota bacterium]
MSGLRAKLRSKLLASWLAACLLLSCFSSASFAVDQPDKLNDWCLQAINAQAKAQEYDNPVRIALIDSGVNPTSKWLEQGKIIAGYNYVLRSNTTYDRIGHGTQVASIILGYSDANSELTGISGNAELIPLVWISKYPSGVLASGGTAALVSAIRAAVDTYDCQIINISAGLLTDELELRDAVAYAEQEGVIVIAAAGNANHYAPEQVYYPAAYETVIGVGAVDQSLQVAAWSQRNTSVTVAAPGVGVYSLEGGQVARLVPASGTSYAAAYVTAVASAVLSVYPQITPAEFREALQASAQDLGDVGYDTAYGHGLVDLERCLSEAGGQ